MIGYRYVDRQQKKEFVVVTEDVKEKLEEWQRNLAEFWGEYGGIITSYTVIGGLLLTVATKGGALPASATAIIILLFMNRKLANPTECNMS